MGESLAPGGAWRQEGRAAGGAGVEVPAGWGEATIHEAEQRNAGPLGVIHRVKWLILCQGELARVLPISRVRDTQ